MISLVSLRSLRASPTFTVVVCTVAMFADGFVYGIVLPVFPFILSSRLSVTENRVKQWNAVLLSSYAIAILFTTPLAGWLTDTTFDRRLVFIAAIVLLVVSNIILCFTHSIELFLIGRILQGISSAITWTASLALLVNNNGRVSVGQAMGFCSVGLHGAMFLAPVVGGALLQYQGYFSVYAVLYAIMAVDLLLRLALIELSDPHEEDLRLPTDILRNETGPCMSTLNNIQSAPFWVVNFGRNGTPSIAPSPRGTDDIEPLLLSTHNRLRLRCFPAHRTNGFKHHMLFYLLRNRKIRMFLWINFAEVTVMAAFDATLPLYAHETFCWGPLASGLVFLAIAIPTFFSPLVGKLSDSIGPRVFVIGGFSLGTPCLIFLRLINDDSKSHVVGLVGLLSLISISGTLIVTPAMAEITYLVNREETAKPGVFGKRGAYAQAYSLYFWSFAAAILVGPLWAGFIQHAVGWANLTLSFGLFWAGTTILLLLFLR